MQLGALLAAAGLTASAHGLLLPPELSNHDVEALEAIPVESVATAQTQTINLDCPGCPPVFRKHLAKPKHQGKPHSSHLELNFAVEGDSQSNRLTVNGFELYPNSDPFSNVLVAPQVAEKPKHHKDHNKHVKDGDNTKALLSHHKFRPEDFKIKAVDQQLGFSLQIHPVTKTADDGLDLVVVDLQIIEVGSVFVDGLPNVRVNMIKTPNNDLMIAKIEQTASENVSTPMDEEKECTTIICKWRAIIAQQIGKMKSHGCAGMMSAKGGKGGHGHGHPEHHGKLPGHMRQPGWALLFRKFTSHIILPVFIGIVAGVSVSIVGMIVGTVLVGLWRKFVRGQSFFPQHRCRRHASHHKAPKNEAAVAEEKSALMEAQEDLPPSYEDGDVSHEERV